MEKPIIQSLWLGIPTRMRETGETGITFNNEKGISAYPKKLRDIRLFLFL